MHPVRVLHQAAPTQTGPHSICMGGDVPPPVAARHCFPSRIACTPACRSALGGIAFGSERSAVPRGNLTSHVNFPSSHPAAQIGRRTRSASTLGPGSPGHCLRRSKMRSVSSRRQRRVRESLRNGGLWERVRDMAHICVPDSRGASGHAHSGCAGRPRRPRPPLTTARGNVMGRCWRGGGHRGGDFRGYSRSCVSAAKK